jgi:ubiquinone/menaquinone biosynthesis C-methylase UbiE
MKDQPTTSAETERVRRFYGRSANSYDGWMRFYDRLLLDNRRRSICAQATGRTLELAIGTGLNLPFFPRDVDLVGIDLSFDMLAIAGRRARLLGLDVDLRVADGQALGLPDSSFDTVVATLFLSTVPDPRRAIAEAWRVLRPGGRLLLLDHVRSPTKVVRLMQRLLEPLISRAFHVHLLRDPLDDLEPLGFRIESSERSRGGLIEEAVARKEG